MNDEKIAVGHSTGHQDTSAKALEELKHIRTVDTVHQDEALKVLARYAGDESWTPAEEKAVTRKIDKKLIWILMVTYGLQYYDKAMLSQAVSISLFTCGPHLLTDFPGSVRSQDGSQPQRWKPLLLLCQYLLSRLHCRLLSCSSHGPALAH